MKTVCLIIIAFMLTLFKIGVANGQESGEGEDQRVFLNDIINNDLLNLNDAQLLLSAKSLRNENLICKITQGNKLVKQFIVPLEYGMNSIDISVNEFQSNLEKGELYNFHFTGRYFGKGHFRFKVDDLAIINTPLLDIAVNPIEVNCEENFGSTIEFFGSVSGGSAPYSLTWFVSRGPYLSDLITQPINFELNNTQDKGEVLIGEPLEYFVTLLVKDACGNTNKKVVHVMCDQQDKNGMIYFQPIEVPNVKSEL